MTKRRAGWAVATAILWLVAASASAQGPQRMGPGPSASGEGPRRMLPADERPARPALPAGELREGETRGRGPHLSPEERRQLRRDVHEAGRDLYPGRMSPGRRQGGRE